jgi:DNA-binding protein
MVLIEHLGDDLGEDYVVINISKDVRFADEIKKRAEAKNRVVIKAWGKAISLAVRLALSAVELDLPGFKIGTVIIGTEKDVEIPARPRSRDQDTDDEDHDAVEGKEGHAGDERITKAMSWMEIAIEKA